MIDEGSQLPYSPLTANKHQYNVQDIDESEINIGSPVLFVGLNVTFKRSGWGSLLYAFYAYINFHLWIIPWSFFFITENDYFKIACCLCSIGGGLSLYTLFMALFKRKFIFFIDSVSNPNCNSRNDEEYLQGKLLSRFSFWLFGTFLELVAALMSFSIEVFVRHALLQSLVRKNHADLFPYCLRAQCKDEKHMLQAKLILKEYGKKSTLALQALAPHIKVDRFRWTLGTLFVVAIFLTVLIVLGTVFVVIKTAKEHSRRIELGNPKGENLVTCPQSLINKLCLPFLPVYHYHSIVITQDDIEADFEEDEDSDSEYESDGDNHNKDVK